MFWVLLCLGLSCGSRRLKRSDEQVVFSVTMEV